MTETRGCIIYDRLLSSVCPPPPTSPPACSIYPPFVYLGTGDPERGESTARALARFHSYSCPVTTSRIIRPSGITNDVEGTPQAPPPLLCTPVLPLPLSITVPSLSFSRSLAFLAKHTVGRCNEPPSAFPCWSLSPAGCRESIRRNVALTGSYERHGKNRQASHKHL